MRSSQQLDPPRSLTLMERRKDVPTHMINQAGPLNLYSEWNVSNHDKCIKYSLLWAEEVDIWDI